MVSLEFNGLGAGEIKRDPEVETLLVTRDNRTEVMKKGLHWLTEGANQAVRCHRRRVTEFREESWNKNCLTCSLVASKIHTKVSS